MLPMMLVTLMVLIMHCDSSTVRHYVLPPPASMLYSTASNSPAERHLPSYIHYHGFVFITMDAQGNNKHWH